MPTLYQQQLTDWESNHKLSDFRINSSELRTRAGVTWWIHYYRLNGGLQENVEVVEIHNGALHFLVLPTRGMGIYQANYGELRLGWDSPVKTPVHPSLINLQERGGLGWLKGFNEWIVRCGLNSMGAPGPDVMVDNNGNQAEEMLTLHGKIANLPAHNVSLEITDNEVILRGEVDEAMLFGPCLRLQTEIRTRFNSGRLRINDTVTNLGRNPTEHQLLYHINYGEPLLEDGAHFAAPIKQMAPRDSRAAESVDGFERYAGPEPGYVEQVYFIELVGQARIGETAVMLRNARGNQASVVRYSLSDFPCFTLWKNTAAREDGYVTGLEPGTAYPNPRQFEREKGRVITLRGGESRSTTLMVEALTTRKAVLAAEKEIRTLQKRAKRKVHPKPIARYSKL